MEKASGKTFHESGTDDPVCRTQGDPLCREPLCIRFLSPVRDPGTGKSRVFHGTRARWNSVHIGQQRRERGSDYAVKLFPIRPGRRKLQIWEGGFEDELRRWEEGRRFRTNVTRDGNEIAWKYIGRLRKENG